MKEKIEKKFNIDGTTNYQNNEEERTKEELEIEEGYSLKRAILWAFSWMIYLSIIAATILTIAFRCGG